ncbi:MAG: hypothetical protein QOD74_1989, partial [Variibacter sp.]|nr:hypothetical protein [Variibacter sp.]
VAGERLVLVAEQGLGDTIQMCRFAPLLAARGVDVTILAKPSMRALLSALPGVTIASSAEELKQDKRPIRWLPLMSLPHVLGVTPDTVPADVPYLAAAPERVTRWAERLSGDGFRIGINWAAGHGSDRHFVRRNIPLAAFAPLAALPGVRLIALQKGEASSEITHAPFKVEWPGMDFDAGADAFLDTAAVMMNLDLVVSCDTSVAHLAGALGRKTFVALPQIADWRWLLGREDTPWYPTVRLFRQRKRGDWPEMMVRIADAARALI